MEKINIQNLLQHWETIQELVGEKWQIFKQNPFVQSLRLDKPVTTLLMLWPALWGFFYAGGGFLIFIKLILLMVALRVACCLYDDITTPEVEVTGDRRHMAQPSVWVLVGAVLISAVIASQIYAGVLFLVLTWFVLVAIYPYLFKMIWWPQVYGGVIFGLWPALMGVTAGGDISFGSILICFAAFFWMIALETMRAGAFKAEDMANSLKSVALWMGDRSISFVVACFVLAFVFLVFSGMSVGAGGLYYGCLMVAQWLFIRHYHGEAETKISQETLFYATWVAILITIGLLIGA